MNTALVRLLIKGGPLGIFGFFVLFNGGVGRAADKSDVPGPPSVLMLDESQLEELKSKASKGPEWYRAVKELDKGPLQELLAKSWVLEEKENRQCVWQVLRWLAYRDADAALAWLTVRAVSDSSHDCWRALITGWRERNPTAALEYVLAMKDYPRQGDLLSLIFIQQIKSDLPWVRQKLAIIPTPELQYQAVGGLSWSLAIRDPEFACRLIIQFEGFSRVENNTVSAFSQWGRQDPLKAWAFIESMEAGHSLYASAMDGFARGLMLNDMEQGMSFLDDMQRAGYSKRVLYNIGLECGVRYEEKGLLIWQRLEQPEDADRFAEGFLNRFGQRQPEKASVFVDKVHSKDLKLSLIRTISRSWAARDPKAARDWVESFGISEEDKKDLIHNLETAKGSL